MIEAWLHVTQTTGDNLSSVPPKMADTLLNDAALELREDRQHAEHGPAGRRAGVERLDVKVQVLLRVSSRFKPWISLLAFCCCDTGLELWMNRDLSGGSSRSSPVSAARRSSSFTTRVPGLIHRVP
jgi:hypothetical protein